MKVKHNYVFVKGDLQATKKEILTYTLVSFVGAFLAASCGTSSGPILNQILIFWGVHVQVAFGTALYMSMFTSLTASIGFILFKKLRMDYGIYVLIMTIIGTIPGTFFQRYIY